MGLAKALKCMKKLDLWKILKFLKFPFARKTTTFFLQTMKNSSQYLSQRGEIVKYLKNFKNIF